MAEAVVTFVLEQLGEFLVESIVREAKLLYGVSDQINAAKAELRRMRCFLRDADKRARGGDERVLNWVSEIREATYDLEDAILTYAAEVARRNEGGMIRNALKRLARLFGEGVELQRVGTKIASLTTGISGLRASLETYGVRDLSGSGEVATSSTNERQRELRRVYSHVVEQDVVGLDKDIKKLVAVLVRQGNIPSCHVVSICGMGGLGKTTLARKVYQRSQIRSHFDCFAWASISQQCQVASVWKEILVKLCPQEKENMGKSTTTDAEICRKLYDIQKERKCLIILDDIWTTEIWDCLSPAFPRDETNSKILVTTRNKDLASYVDENGLIHEPLCLNDQESWELLEKVFKESQTNLDDAEQKKKLAKEMVKHCGGLPLAIIVLRGILSRKQAIFEWEAVQSNAKEYINSGKVSELRDSKSLGVSWVLGLSYDELPYPLKPCFLYLAHFPEDQEIRVDELCQMWMAEGFVPSEDRAYEYFYELAQRCMVQRGAMSSMDGRIRTCSVHDLMRDLCLLKAQEENFLKVISFTSRHEVNMGSLASDKIRRVAMIFLKGNVLSHDEMVTIIRDDCLRSAMFFGPQYFHLKTMRSWFKCFHMLRVLKLNIQKRSFSSQGRPSFKVPKEIGMLFHLRFLSFRDCEVRSLPSSVCKLRQLQTLDLRISDFSHDDPLRNVAKWRFGKLRHLYLPSKYVLCDEKLSFENVSSLQTLVGVSASYPGFSRLAQMTNLSKLEVHNGKDWDSGVTFDKLRSLTVIQYTVTGLSLNIKQIILSCPRVHKLKVVGWIEKLPEHSQFSPNLAKLTLKDLRHYYDLMPTLEKLPKLKILCLLNASNLEEFAFSRGGFPRLESLYLFKLNIVEWRVEEGAFPCLRHLTLDKFLGWEMILDGFRNFAALKVSLMNLDGINRC